MTMWIYVGGTAETDQIFLYISEKQADDPPDGEW